MGGYYRSSVFGGPLLHTAARSIPRKEEHVARSLETYKSNPSFSPGTRLPATLTTTMKTSNPPNMPQSRTITQLFTETDLPSFWLGFAAASALKLLATLVHAPPALPQASTTIGLLGAAAMPCGIYAITTAVVQSDVIAEEEDERKKGTLEQDKETLEHDVADKPRDDGSLLSIRSEMRMAARFRVHRRACFGVALLFGGCGVWINWMAK